MNTVFAVAASLMAAVEEYLDFKEQQPHAPVDEPVCKVSRLLGNLLTTVQEQVPDLVIEYLNASTNAGLVRIITESGHRVTRRTLRPFAMMRQNFRMFNEPNPPMAASTKYYKQVCDLFDLFQAAVLRTLLQQNLTILLAAADEYGRLARERFAEFADHKREEHDLPTAGLDLSERADRALSEIVDVLEAESAYLLQVNTISTAALYQLLEGLLRERPEGMTADRSAAFTCLALSDFCDRYQDPANRVKQRILLALEQLAEPREPPPNTAAS